MESVATFMMVLIIKLMPHIKLCIIYKHGAITLSYKNMIIEVICIYNRQYDAHFKRTIIDLSVSIQKLLQGSLFPSLCNHYRLILCPYTLDAMNWYKIIFNVTLIAIG